MMNATLTVTATTDTTGETTLTAEGTNWTAVIAPEFLGYRSVQLFESGHPIGDGCANNATVAVERAERQLLAFASR